MDFTNRLALAVSIGLSSFATGLSLTATGCDRTPASSEATPSAAAPSVAARAAAADAPRTAATAVPVPSATLAATTAALGPSTPAPRTAPPATTSVSASGVSGLRVARVVVTHAVKDREPVLPAELGDGAPVLAFIELKNESAQPRSVVVTFERPDRPAVGYVELEVPANVPRYRTWARTHNLKQSGTWTVVVRDKAGGELARSAFVFGSTASAENG